MSYRVYDEFDKTMVSKKENGDLIVSAQMPEDEWLIGYLLSFGTQVDIIEPAYLKDIVAEQAQGITECLKEENALEWTGRMNNIRACAREIVDREIIYA